MGSSQLSQAFIVLLLLCVIPCLAESAIPSHQQPLSVIGRKSMSGQIHTGPSPHRRAPIYYGSNPGYGIGGSYSSTSKLKP